MAGQMYFGNRNYMQWVKCPDTGMGKNRQHWNVDGIYLNGGGYARRSLGGHNVYEMAWNLVSQDQADQILDYEDGVYGDGLIYFLDPFDMERNVLPQHWATPALAGDDAPALTNERPVTASASTVGGLPANSATYTLDEDTVSVELWLPVPPGYHFHLAGFGVSRAGTAALTITPDTGSAVNVTGNTPVVLSNAGGGVTLALSGEGTITLQGLVARVRSTSGAIAMPFKSGGGHSGCAFSGDTSLTGYSAVRDQLALSVTLKEVGAWAA